MPPSLIRPLTFASAAVVSAVLLSACGGGGNGEDPAVVAAQPDASASADAAAATDSAAVVDASAALADEAALADDAALAAVDEESTAADAEPAAGEREAAQATGFATPKVAAVDYTQDMSTTRRAHLARYKFVIVNLSKSKGASAMNSFTGDIKRRNPSVKIAHYVAHNEVPCSSSSGDNADLVTEVNRANWWLRSASGSKVQWTTSYGNCDINITQWGPRNSAGRTWAQYKWSRDNKVWFANMPAVDYVHIDNVFWRYRKDADFRRNRTNQSKDTYAYAWRQGFLSYLSAVRATDSHYKFSVNADNTLNYPEYTKKFDMAFLEGVIGKSWSYEGTSWTYAMDYYRRALANTKTPGNAVLQAFTSPTDYAKARYGLAMAMLEDGYFMQTNYPGRQAPSWFDEFNAQIGTAIESPPRAPKQNGIWMRKYQNGLVLVNPHRSNSATINVGSGYKRLSGSQQPSVNNGRAQSSVTLPPRSGLLMLRS